MIWERQTLVYCSTHPFIHWVPLTCVQTRCWTRWEDAPTHQATWPGLVAVSINIDFLDGIWCVMAHVFICLFAICISSLMIFGPFSFLFVLRLYLFIFREREREGKRGEKHWCVRDTSVGCQSVASPMPPIRDLAHNTGMCPDWELNWRPFGFQASTQSIEPYLPEQIHLLIGLFVFLLLSFKSSDNILYQMSFANFSPSLKLSSFFLSG